MSVKIIGSRERWTELRVVPEEVRVLADGFRGLTLHLLGNQRMAHKVYGVTGRVWLSISSGTARLA